MKDLVSTIDIRPQVDKADGEWTLVCLVHNIKKIYARIMAKGGELDALTGK